MNLTFVKNLSDDVATMLLYQEIGKNSGIDGAQFAEEMYYLGQRVPKINVRINSPGGSIFEGYSIYSAMREVKANVDTYNDFIAASMAGIIFQQGRKRYSADNGIIMLHNPSGGGESKKDIEILGVLKNSLVDSYTQRTGKDGKIISDMMEVETWIEARETNGVSPMLELGLADKLFSGSVKIAETAQVYNVSKLYSYANNILKTDTMENEKINELSKALEDVKNELEAIKKVASEKDEEIEALKKANDEKDAILKDANDKAAVELIENAIKEGKVKAEQKESLINDAKASFNVVKNMLNSVAPSNAARFTNVVNAVSTKAVEAGREDWTHRDYEEKDPKALEKIYKETPELAKEMYNSYYKK